MRLEYRPDTRTIVNPDAWDEHGEPIVIARDVDARHGPTLAAAHALAWYVRDCEVKLIRRRLDDAEHYKTVRRLLDTIDVT